APARARRTGRGPGRGAGGAGQRRRPLLRRRPRGAAQRRGYAQAHHPRRRRRGPRTRRAAARRRPQRAPGRDHRARRARPARLPQRQPGDGAGTGRGRARRDGAGAMSATDAASPRPGAWPVYRRLLGYAGRYWPLLVASSIGMVVEALAGGAFVKLMDPLVNRGFVNPEPRMAVLLPLAIIALFVIRSLATYVTDY